MKENSKNSKINMNKTAKEKCESDNGEWHKHFCTGDCKTCNYNKD